MPPRPKSPQKKLTLDGKRNLTLVRKRPAWLGWCSIIGAIRTEGPTTAMQGCLWLCSGHSHEGCLNVTSLVFVSWCPPDTF